MLPRDLLLLGPVRVTDQVGPLLGDEMEKNQDLPASVGEFERVGLVVEHYLLKPLLVEVDCFLVLSVESYEFTLDGDATRVRLVHLDLHNLIEGDADVKLLYVLGELAFLEPGQGQNVFDVEVQQLARADRDRQALLGLL